MHARTTTPARCRRTAHCTVKRVVGGSWGDSDDRPPKNTQTLAVEQRATAPRRMIALDANNKTGREKKEIHTKTSFLYVPSGARTSYHRFHKDLWFFFLSDLNTVDTYFESPTCVKRYPRRNAFVDVSTYCSISKNQNGKKYGDLFTRRFRMTKKCETKKSPATNFKRIRPTVVCKSLRTHSVNHEDWPVSSKEKVLESGPFFKQCSFGVVAANQITKTVSSPSLCFECRKVLEKNT